MVMEVRCRRLCMMRIGLLEESGIGRMSWGFMHRVNGVRRGASWLQMRLGTRNTQRTMTMASGQQLRCKNSLQTSDIIYFVFVMIETYL